MPLSPETHLEKQIEPSRNRIDILACILGVAQHAALKTHIMYKANLSHRQLEKYLDFLLSQGLIEEAVDEECGRTNYRVSQRGIVFLKDYARLSTYLEAEEK